MTKRSAGILVFRGRGGELELLLAHPGGPFWVNKDEGAWSIPKGEIEPAEEPFHAALREFREETGLHPQGEAIPLTPVRQPGGKVVLAWAVRQDLDLAGFRSASFAMEWPPRSGRMVEFPEIDRVAWLPMGVARQKILRGQSPLLAELHRIAGSTTDR